MNSRPPSPPLAPLSRPLDHLPLCGAAGASALICGGADHDYAALEAMTGRLAAWLANQTPGPGARVASWLGKNRLSAVLPLAAARAGRIHVPINPLLKPAQAAHILADSGAALLIAAPARLQSLRGGDWRVADDAAALAVLDGPGPALPPSAAAPGDLAALLYTSGSTGRPKGVMLTHANLWLGAASVADYLGLTPADRVLAVLPLSFDYGQNQLLSAWFAGASVAPIDYLTPRDVVKAAAALRPTTLAGVPPLWHQLVAADWPDGAAASFTRLTNSGGALTPGLIAAMQRVFAGAAVVPMYGLTEAFRSTFLPPDLVSAHPTSMGRAIPYAEIFVCRADGSVCADDEAGELVHCGPLVAAGYWRDAARTAERFRPAPAASRWGGTAVWSGDRVVRDAAGLHYFAGRDDAMIKSAGNRISPTEIEDAALASGLVGAAVAVGVPDRELGQAIVLVVAGGDDHAAVDALRAALRAELPGFMQPGRIVWLSDLPQNPNGKLDRAAIADACAEAAA